MKMNFEQFFKRKLDVPQQPPADSWEYIKTKINQKETEKKRYLPFWMRLSGIAAVGLLLVGLGFFMDNKFFHFNSSSSQNSPAISGNSTPTDRNAVSNSKNLDLPQSDGSMGTIGVENSSLNYLTTSRQFASHSISNQNSNFYQRAGWGKNPILSALNTPSTQPETVYNSYESTYQNQNEIPIALLNDLDKLPKWNPENLGIEKILEEIPQPKPEESKLLLAQNSKSNENTPKNKKKINYDRFYISGFVAPIAMNTFVGNSMLADNLSQYRTENNVTLAYGIKAGYALNKNIKVRTGVSVIGFEQMTYDVPFSYEVEGKGGAHSITDENNIRYRGKIRIDQPYNSLANNELSNRAGIGKIQQQVAYYEIPVEAEISIFQTSSIGISATAGGSTLLLSKNKIYAYTDEISENMGEATNLNKTSFSANAGLKFDLKLTDQIQFNVEPNFKYLMNPVNNIEKFNPYTVGVNAGVTVSFK